MTQPHYDRLLRLCRVTDAATQAECIRDSLKLREDIVRLVHEGYSIIAQKGDERIGVVIWKTGQPIETVVDSVVAAVGTKH